MHKGKVLLVEDREDLREMYVRFLEGFGQEVQTAANGEEGLAKARAGAFDLVLTDVQMPGKIDGVGLVKHLKAEKPGLDVIVMTAFPNLEGAISTLKDGAYDYLTKPFGRDQLQLVLTRCLDKRRIQAELGEEKSLRKELQAAYSELQKAEKLKDAFMARVSHELRTPVFVASSAVELLAGSPLEGPMAKMAVKAKDALQRLTGVVTDLLMFSDLLKGDRKLERKAVDLKAVIEEQLAAYKLLYDQKELKLTVALPAGLAPVQGDPELLRTAFRHLVVNAALFNRLRGEVAIRVKDAGKAVLVELENTGQGIPPEQADRVFDTFYQIADELTREVGGLGLGLAIVRRIVEAHGGAIRATTRQGEGAVFYLDLPKG